MTKPSMISTAKQRLKGGVNQALGALGYRLVRADTLEQLVRQPGPDHSPAQISTSASGSAQPRLLSLLPATNAPPSMCTAHAPRFDSHKTPSQLADKIVAFQQNGVTVISTNPEKAAMFRETEQFDRDVSNRHSAWDWAGNSVAPYTQDLQTGMPSAALVDYLRVLFSGGDFDAFFRGVLGCPAKVANVRLVRSKPHLTDGVGPQEWHSDGCPAGVIRGVLYLCDVDEQTGPFQYRDANHRDHTVLGKTGDLLVFDATRLMHRGSPPTHKTRSAIDLVFMPRMPDEEMQIMVVGMNHWPADPFFVKVPKERPADADALGSEGRTASLY
ncbi:protein of unknown function [Bradyrhizobium sp. ORS 285]|uniref:2OG-Fe(II) oxygenase n=1 Tax=Bradyrhizobium sp. ORS 285 TaxID=115808 RepID=UPI000240B119|nr:2OG-Fe(II) oxygenase [Bradyrhizobium sp. ORS 285]CCD83622.1 hypothetical protein BRAO285_100033 [Bradyrhizobium sp. ORS 285]SMX57199.1 protein of unknown function [Bradyrhizobium sp. ORS 285]